MNNLAVIKTGGKQYLVSAGQEIKIEKIPGKVGDKVYFDQVLLVNQQEGLKIGQPLVKNIKVEGEIVNQLKGKKIKVFKYKAKSRYRRQKGHRQQLTLVKINTITSNSRENKA